MSSQKQKHHTIHTRWTCYSFFSVNKSRSQLHLQVEMSHITRGPRAAADLLASTEPRSPRIASTEYEGLGIRAIWSQVYGDWCVVAGVMQLKLAREGGETLPTRNPPIHIGPQRTI